MKQEGGENLEHAKKWRGNMSRRHFYFRRLIVLRIILASFLTVTSMPVLAACDNPEGIAGSLFFNPEAAVMQYCNGIGWISMLSSGTAADPVECDTVGMLCSDGSIYAGVSPDGNTSMFTMATDWGTTNWNNSNAAGYVDSALENCVLGSESACLSGQANTLVLAAEDADSETIGQQSHRAAVACDNLVSLGHNDWYLPAIAELAILYANREIGSLAGTFALGSDYWSSSEIDATQAQYFSFEYGFENTGNKTYSNYIRCIRKRKSANITGCVNPSGPAGAMVFNKDYRVLQWCDGVEWQAVAPLNPGGTDAGCLDPNGASGDLIFNADYCVMQFCDGAGWQAITPEVPKPFTFVDQSELPYSTAIYSNIVEIDGFPCGGASIAVTPTSGRYQICEDSDCASVLVAWTAAAGTVENGQYVQLRRTSRSNGGTNDTTLTVGTLSDVWSITTPLAPCTLPWGGTIAHGDSVTAWSFLQFNGTACNAADCQSTVRTCNNGSLSGSDSYDSESCTAAAEAEENDGSCPANCSTSFTGSSCSGFTWTYFLGAAASASAAANLCKMVKGTTCCWWNGVNAFAMNGTKSGTGTTRSSCP